MFYVMKIFYVLLISLYLSFIRSYYSITVLLFRFLFMFLLVPSLFPRLFPLYSVESSSLIPLALSPLMDESERIRGCVRRRERNALLQIVWALVANRGTKIRLSSLRRRGCRGQRSREREENGKGRCKRRKTSASARGRPAVVVPRHSTERLLPLLLQVVVVNMIPLVIILTNAAIIHCDAAAPRRFLLPVPRLGYPRE
jgi:hypothetical protein